MNDVYKTQRVHFRPYSIAKYWKRGVCMIGIEKNDIPINLFWFNPQSEETHCDDKELTQDIAQYWLCKHLEKHRD